VISLPRYVYPISYLLIIKHYLVEKKQRCFTYRGFRAWLFRQREYRDMEWHTMERVVRKLAEQGFLTRVEKSKRCVLFCWNDLAERAYREYMRSVMGN